MARIPNTFTSVQKLRQRYLQALPGKESLIKMLVAAELPEHVYNSNAIENSTLTLEETDKILAQIELDRYISERELFEAKNLARVIEYMDARAATTEVTLELMTLLHKMLISNIRDDIAGRFRNPTEWVRTGTYIAVDPKEVIPRLTTMLLEYAKNPHEHIIKRIAKFHLTFEYIHPFCDGNGRIGRVLNNYLLIREGYVPINIAFANRAEYYAAFKEFQVTGGTSGMEEIVGRALTNSYHKRLAYMESKHIMSLHEYARKTKTSIQNSINKAKRQTIEAFIENGKWKIGV